MMKKVLKSLVGESIVFVGLGDDSPRRGQLLSQSGEYFYFSIADGRTKSFTHREVFHLAVNGNGATVKITF